MGMPPRFRDARTPDFIRRAFLQEIAYPRSRFLRAEPPPAPLEDENLLAPAFLDGLAPQDPCANRPAESGPHDYRVRIVGSATRPEGSPRGRSFQHRTNPPETYPPADGGKLCHST